MLIESLRSFKKRYSPELCLKSFSSQHALHIEQLQLIEEPNIEPTWKCNAYTFKKIWRHSKGFSAQSSAMLLTTQRWTSPNGWFKSKSSDSGCMFKDSTQKSNQPYSLCPLWMKTSLRTSIGMVIRQKTNEIPEWHWYGPSSQYNWSSPRLSAPEVIFLLSLPNSSWREGTHMFLLCMVYKTSQRVDDNVFAGVT